MISITIVAILIWIVLYLVFTLAEVLSDKKAQKMEAIRIYGPKDRKTKKETKLEMTNGLKNTRKLINKRLDSQKTTKYY